MGHARRRPKRLAEKLREIRIMLGLSQAELHKSLGVDEDIAYTRISDYELDKNEPSLLVPSRICSCGRSPLGTYR